MKSMVAWLMLSALPLTWGAQTNFTVLTHEHSDFRILYAPGSSNLLSLEMRDQDNGINQPSNAVILVVLEGARLTLPAGTPFGDAGQPLWILPQSQNLSLLYMGVSAEGVPGGVFAGPLALTLKRFDGPGYLMAWQATGPGQYNIRLNTRDGLSAADAFSPLIGSHEHFNWGFSSTGVFSLTFQVSGQRFGESTNILSPETTFVFHVRPLPPATNYQTWARGHWPPGFHPPTTQPNADPDADGSANLLEYATGTSPTNPASANRGPGFRLVNTNGLSYGGVAFTRFTPARDLEFIAEAASTLPGAWTILSNLVSTTTANDTEQIIVRDNVTFTNAPRRFYRLRATRF